MNYIKRNLKKCIECREMRYIFSKGRCEFCAKKSYKPISRVRKPTGEKEVFKEIWEERPQYCTNCTKFLGQEARAFYFAHILPKGKFPKLRLEKENIMLLCMQCHNAYDHGTKEEYKDRRAGTEVDYEIRKAEFKLYSDKYN